MDAHTLPQTKYHAHNIIEKDIQALQFGQSPQCLRWHDIPFHLL